MIVDDVAIDIRGFGDLRGIPGYQHTVCSHSSEGQARWGRDS